MRRAVFVSCALLVAAGCAAIAGIEETTTIAATDARIPDSDTDVGAADGTDLPPDDPDSDIIVRPNEDPDATLPDEEAGTAPDGGTACKLGAKTAFVPTVSGVVVEVCRPDQALAQGGAFAGLDCYGTGVHQIGPKNVTACMAIDYGTPNLASAIIHLAAVSDGCGHPCIGTSCADQIAAHVYVGTAGGISTWTYVGTAPITRAGGNYDFKFPPGNWRVVGICRSGHGSADDDVAVDGISATCR